MILREFRDEDDLDWQEWIEDFWEFATRASHANKDFK
jgi:hypothetical protein